MKNERVYDCGRHDHLNTVIDVCHKAALEGPRLSNVFRDYMALVLIMATNDETARFSRLANSPGSAVRAA